jgi:hypothetical protein
MRRIAYGAIAIGLGLGLDPALPPCPLGCLSTRSVHGLRVSVANDISHKSLSLTGVAFMRKR